jgi:hypothetical protein
MAKLELELHRENREVETIRLDAQRVLIGSDAHCELPLPADEAAPEQVLLEVLGTVLRVTARSASPPLLIDGKRAVRGTLASGGTLGLGRVTLRVWIDRGRNHAASSASPLWRRGVLLACGAFLLAVAAGLGAVLASDSRKKAAPSAPELWTQVSASCPATGTVEALALAPEKRALAEAKAQRHPFIAREGVESVQLYRVAADCARVGGAHEQSKALLSEADALRRAIDADYRVRRLRLEYSLKIGDKRTAAREASMIRELLRSGDGAYVRWLATLERKLGSENRGLLRDIEGVTK